MNKRLEILIDALYENKSSFAMKIGMVSQTLNMYLNGRRTITNKFMKRIKGAYPQINLEWIKTEKGNMFAGNEIKQVSPNNIINAVESTQIDIILKKMELFEQEVKILRKKNELLESENLQLKEKIQILE